MRRAMRRVGGTPIEEAPVWALALFAGVLWLVVFPALVGVLDGFGLVPGGGWAVAAGAVVISVLLTTGLARQRPWRRPPPGRAGSEDEMPRFVRFSTWLWTTLLVPNFLYGMLVILREGEGLGFLGAWVLGTAVSAAHGAFALVDRHRRKRAAAEAEERDRDLGNR